MEVRPGIHQLPGLRWANAYLLVEDQGLTLIDSGTPGDGRKILRYIRSIGRDPAELARVVLTHSHPDHTGLLEGLARRTGASITVHQADTRQTAKSGGLRLHYPAQPPSFGWDIPFLHRIPAHQVIEDGQVLPILDGLQVMHTPGHTPGSVCFYLADQAVLFTGDTLLADGHCFRRPVPFPGTNFRPLPGLGGAAGPVALRNRLRRPWQAGAARGVGAAPGDAGALFLVYPPLEPAQAMVPLPDQRLASASPRYRPTLAGSKHSRRIRPSGRECLRASPLIDSQASGHLVLAT